MNSHRAETTYNLPVSGMMSVFTAGTVALTLLPLNAHAQFRGGGAGFGGGAVHSYSPAVSRPTYTPSFSRPSYTPNFSRPAYTPNYSRPSYSPGVSRSTYAPGAYNPSFYYPGNSNASVARPSNNFGASLGQRPNPNYPFYRQNYTPTPTRSGSPIHSVPVAPPLSNNYNLSYNRFNNSAEALRYRYGVPYHGRYYYGNYGSAFFAGGLAFYPYYSPFYSYGFSTLSPYAYYGGVFPPYISLGGLYNSPPDYVYVPYPVYEDGKYDGYRNDDVDSYYLNQNNQNNSGNSGNGGYRIGENKSAATKDTVLDATVNDIRDSWTSGKLDPIAKHIRRDAKIAVYLRGKYQYSLDSSAYLDMTRDAISATKTTRFDIESVQKKQNGVYTMIARHVYQDKDGKDRTVHVTYVLEKADGDYVITQVGSAPDTIDQ